MGVCAGGGGTAPGVKTVTQDGNDLIIKYGFGDSDAFDVLFTFYKEYLCC